MWCDNKSIQDSISEYNSDLIREIRCRIENSVSRQILALERWKRSKSGGNRSYMPKIGLRSQINDSTARGASLKPLETSLSLVFVEIWAILSPPSEKLFPVSPNPIIPYPILSLLWLGYELLIRSVVFSTYSYFLISIFTSSLITLSSICLGLELRILIRGIII